MAASIGLFLICSLFGTSLAIDCAQMDGPGDNIDVSATCYTNGTVVYEWMYTNEEWYVENAQIDYTCTSNGSDLSGVKNLNSDLGSASLVLPDWGPDSFCLFHGCYIFSKVSADFPTLGIPTVTCTAPLMMTTSTTLQPVPTSTVTMVTSTVVSSVLSTALIGHSPTTSYRHSDTTSNRDIGGSVVMSSYSVAATIQQPDADVYRANLPFIAIPLAVVMAALLILIGIAIIVQCTKRSSSQKLRERINDHIASQPYDATAPDIISVLPAPPQSTQTDIESVHNFLDSNNYKLKQPHEVCYDSETEEERLDDMHHVLDPESVSVKTEREHPISLRSDKDSMTVQSVNESGYVPHQHSGMTFEPSEEIDIDITDHDHNQFEAPPSNVPPIDWQIPSSHFTGLIQMDDDFVQYDRSNAMSPTLSDGSYIVFDWQQH